MSPHVAMWRPLAQLCVAGSLWFCLSFVCYEYHATGGLCDSHRLRMELDSEAQVLDLSENYEDFNPRLGLYNLIVNF